MGVGFPVAEQVTDTLSPSFMLDTSGSIVTFGITTKKQNNQHSMKTAVEYSRVVDNNTKGISLEFQGKKAISGYKS